MKQEILELIEIQEKRFKRRIEELELRKGKRFEDSIKENTQIKSSKNGGNTK